MSGIYKGILNWADYNNFFGLDLTLPMAKLYRWFCI